MTRSSTVLLRSGLCLALVAGGLATARAQDAAKPSAPGAATVKPGAAADVPPEGPPDGPGFDFGGPPPFGGPGGPMGPGGGPGFGGVTGNVELVKKYDLDGDGRLNAAERKAAREAVEKGEAGGGRRGPGGFGGPGRRGGPGGRGGPFGRGDDSGPVQPGKKIGAAEAKSFAGSPLYDGQVLRTLFLQFENDDWEKELTAFKGSDVEVPATLTVDGRAYPEVGVHYRGMSSYMMVAEGRKKSLNLALDFARKDQQWGSYRTLELLNSHEDASFLRAVLSYRIAREYLPAPKANFVRVVINGENWGVYANAQPFNKDFIRDWYGTTKGARWKVPGSPNGQGSLKYLGEDAAAYKRIYDLKSKDDPKDWAALIRLTKVLNETPPDRLPAALGPLLDIDETLKFLALENVLVNNDGYWVRASDYSLYLDVNGKFHVLPRDSNETFMLSQGPGGFGGPGGPGGRRGFRGPGGPGAGNNGPVASGSPAAPDAAIAQGRGERPEFGGPPGGPRGFGGGPGAGASGDLDPLVGANNAERPLISKLLAVPAYRTRYLRLVHDIADKWLDWKVLGPIASQYHALIAEDVKIDTRKLDSEEDFEKSLEGEVARRAGPGAAISIKGFADQRRAFLLNHAAVKQAVQ